jgi:hypothetical protein
MSNTSRIVNNPPLSDINPDNMLSTNIFIPSIETNDVSDFQKQQYIKYYEQKNKTNQVTKIIEKVNNEYDYYESAPKSKFQKSGVVIKKVNSDIIKIETTSIIDIDSINRNTNLYPTPSYFIIPLGKTFYNIKQIELVSTALPNTDQVITNNPIEIRNNRISWQNSEDIDLGIYKNVSVGNNITSGFIDITIPFHGLSSQLRNGNFYVKITNSTTTPSIDGKRYAIITDENTIRVNFTGGISGPGVINIDVGYPTYTVELTPGNYNASTLPAEISKKMNLIKRNYNTGSVFHFFTVEISLDTDVMTFGSYITKQLLPGPISTSVGTGVISVSSLSHGYKTGDIVLMIGVKNIGGLASSLLNGVFNIVVINSDSFTYEVNERASDASEGGGSTVKTGKPSGFRLIFDIADSLIVNNIGFPDEDSTELIDSDSTTPITTKSIETTAAQVIGNYIRFTSDSHGLYGSNVIDISNVTVGASPTVTTSTMHGLGSSERVYIKYDHTVPKLDGLYSIIVTGNYTFTIGSSFITSNSGGTGTIKYGGDTVILNGFKSIPVISSNIYVIENVTSSTFDIEVSVESIQDQWSNVGTEQLIINHNLHGFNFISSIVNSGSSKAVVTTLVDHGLSGIKYEGVSAETIVLNTVDITISSHGLYTSEIIYITNSFTSPSINGTYNVQVVDTDTFRISFIGGIVSTQNCDVNTGDKTVFSDTNSVPDITTDLNGRVEYYIHKLSDTEFEIDTGFVITTSGTTGILGREQKIALHRSEPAEQGSDNIAGIPLSVVNGNYYDIYKVIDKNNYIIKVGRHATSSTSGGNKTVVTSQKHGFRNFQSNTFNGESSGVLYKSISLEGENYVFLISPNLNTVYSPGNEKVGDVFAKILLNQPPGVMMFDSYISAPKQFNPPLSSLKDLEFSVKRRDGYLFNFNNIDYSLSLRVTEITDRIADSSISSRTGVSDLF